MQLLAPLEFPDVYLLGLLPGLSEVRSLLYVWYRLIQGTVQHNHIIGSHLKHPTYSKSQAGRPTKRLSTIEIASLQRTKEGPFRETSPHNR
jgi:hypothetical protein